MDKRWLATQLAEGASIEAIARDVGRHRSTVAYWVNRYDQASSHAPKHAARGGIARETLEPLIAEGPLRPTHSGAAGPGRDNRPLLAQEAPASYFPRK